MCLPALDWRGMPRDVFLFSHKSPAQMGLFLGRFGTGADYFRAPRCGFFRLVWRRLALARLGLLIVKVPLPRYSALYVLSSANRISSKVISLF